MKIFFLIVLVSLGFLTGVLNPDRLFAAEPLTLTGELVDARCYLKMGMKGEGHRECAVKCASEGYPVGIVEEVTGGFYTLLTSPSSIRELMAMKIRVSGTLYSEGKALIPEKIEVYENGEWIERTLPKEIV